MIALALTLGCSGCNEECEGREQWCEGDTLRVCSRNVSTDLGSHDSIADTDCSSFSATCVENPRYETAACVLREDRCEPDEPNVCSGGVLRPCFEGFARLEPGHAPCEHACMRSSTLLRSYCVEPEPACERAGKVTCRVTHSVPAELDVCVAIGWTAYQRCFEHEICGDPLDESDPCVAWEDAGSP